MIGIYKITSPSNKIYIGQSIDIERRKEEYKRLSCKEQTKLYNSLKKYGWELHCFDIIEECDESKLIERETYWKKYYKVLELPSLCCRTDGRGGSLSKETCVKISNSRKGIKHSQETKIKISINHSSSKKIYQYDVKGNLIKVWDSYSQAERENKGNIKNNILGKTKHSGGYIWLREEDLSLLSHRLDLINQYKNPLLGKSKSEDHKRMLSISIKGKKKNYKKEYLFNNIGLIKKDYETLSVKMLSNKYNVSIFTMLEFLKQNNLYIPRKNTINKIVPL
jgi:hypothetical protein